MPKRIQLSRRKGYRKPEGAVVVARPTKWGNPFKLECDTRVFRQYVVDQFELWLRSTTEGKAVRAAARAELRGKDLCCWCPKGSACHADVLLRVANARKKGSPMTDEELEQLALEVASRLTSYSIDRIKAALVEGHPGDAGIVNDYNCVLDALSKARAAGLA